MAISSGMTSATATLRSGSLGTADIAFVVSAAAPLTVMAGVAPLAILLGGSGAPVGCLLVGITLAVFAVGFTAMSRHVRSGGAFYAFITRGLLRPIGIGAALRGVLATARSPQGAAAARSGLTGLEALEGCTTHAARAAGGSDTTGRIAPGCRADLTALSVDPVHAPVDELTDAPVLLTVTGGHLVHRHI
ncbi:amidohydrolase family protein [Streptomyces sp. NPDC001177]